MKRRYMVIMGFGCLVFAYASVIAGKCVLGYMSGLASVLMGLFLLYVHGIFQIHIGQVVMHLPFVYGCYALWNMPYAVAKQLAIVSIMAVIYSLLYQMLAKELRIFEQREIRRWLLGMSVGMVVAWMLVLVLLVQQFQWILIGQDWVSLVDAVEIEVVSMLMVAGVFGWNAIWSWLQQEVASLHLFASMK